jgi:hypothetical protein
MMSPEGCNKKADMCEFRATRSADAVLKLDWLKMAGYWREMAGDENAAATIARLLRRRSLMD